MAITKGEFGPRTGIKSWSHGSSKLLRDFKEHWAGKPASPSSPYPWAAHVQQLTRETLSSHNRWVEGVFARPEGNVVNIYALTNNTEYDHELAIAFGMLEVKIDKALSSHYEEVRVFPTPSWCLTEVDRDAISRGALVLH
jgi:hypothetical protein